MKILFMSDIHGISENLDYIKQLDERQNFDKIVVLGDLYYPGPSYNKEFVVDSNKVLQFLMNYDKKIIGVKGNCDSNVDIKATDFPISDTLALICVDGLDIYCTHGNEYNKDKNRKFKRKGVLVYGHEHIPYIYKEQDMVYINTGSISLPKNNSKPSYLVYDNKKFTLYSVDGEIIDKIVV